ncbi:MAG: zinc-ribbon domain-containing protein [Agathobacter sp.]|uniref:zinc-ribbon domain-containing protein n=1 Tax=Butyrivibrio fibrisolvens TaxID=831 RepID=UPI0009330FE2|nr:zinc-ribbon domain-containing protein [Agathobacter sp.]MBR4808543.1 zinc-ribbon domain-containing protein [Lachnospiraceae bacterium]
MLCEWDYISNYLIADPDEILESYPKTVWWKCKECGRKYELSPKAKLLFEKRHMKSCKYCKGNRRKMHHFF